MEISISREEGAICIVGFRPHYQHNSLARSLVVAAAAAAAAANAIAISIAIAVLLYMYGIRIYNMYI